MLWVVTELAGSENAMVKGAQKSLDGRLTNVQTRSRRS
jgi:hypothetical protein